MSDVPVDLREQIARELFRLEYPHRDSPWDQRAGWERELFRRRADAVVAVLPPLSAQVAAIEALADRWIGYGVMRSMEGTISARRGQELRDALAANPVPNPDAVPE